jgi:outer membrane receptor protein involved in Fe transport
MLRNHVVKIFGAAFLLALAIGSEFVLAQVLDEVVVTAQRREQSLQDVPISIETITGSELSRQGFRTLNDLSMFAPGLVITESAEENGLLIRGAGTQGKNLAFEQGAPTFIDGIHFGRASSVKNAFMDVERIEVLRGPQPVYFGQNASAGALNITSRRPTEEWEGYIDAELGNFGRQSIEAAVGGPLSDTFGIRVAGRYDVLEGFMRDWETGKKFPQRESKIIRLTLDWQPTDSFGAMFKIESSDLDFGPRAQALIRDRFPESEFNLAAGDSVYLTGLPGLLVPGIANYPVGEVTDLGVSLTGPFLSPTGYTQANTNDTGGFLDITQCTPGMLDTPGAKYQPPERFLNCDFREDSGAEPFHAIVKLDYEFDNGIQVESLTGFSSQEYFTNRNSGGPFVSNPRYRGEDFEQWSSELRFTSPAGGAIEWMAGLYWQRNDLEVQSNVFRMNAFRAMRGNRSLEDAEWLSGFATLTFNFMDDKASIDVGGRYTEVEKFGHSQNLAGEWIVYDPVLDINFTLPYGRRIGGEDYSYLQNAVIVGRTPFFTDPNDFQPGSSVNSRRVASVRANISDNSFDPQIVFRYRASENISTYFKYATAFKAGGYDMAVSEVTSIEEDFTFGPENVDIFELGLRGTFFGGRATGELTLFSSTFEDLQVSYIDRLLDRNITKNAAESRSRGLEFMGRMAVTDRLTASLSGVFMDAEITSFPDAVCTTEEVEIGLCDLEFGTIDRSGQPARNAPDWQFVAKASYDMPVGDRYRMILDGALTASDEFITDRAWQRTVRMDSEVDMNVSVTFGDIDDQWNFTVYGRNLFEVKPTYHPEDDATGEGVITEPLSASNFASYGIKFGYNF